MLFETTHSCRVCGSTQDDPPWGLDGRTPSFEICDGCGTEFGYEDSTAAAIAIARTRFLGSTHEEERMTQIRAISEAEFDCWPRELQVIVHDHPRRFGCISVDGSPQEFALSWRSDLIEPIVVRGDASDVWLGVDQRAACIARNGRIAVSLGLQSFLLQIYRFSNCVALLCETEVVFFNFDNSIRSVCGLHDIPADIAEQEGEFRVTFVDGSCRFLR